MLMRLSVWWGESRVEEYVVPDGSWIQTENLGMQCAIATLEPKIVHGSNKGYCLVEPVKAPQVRGELLKMVNSRDKEWGKNGYEYLGCNRERQGGTALDRLRELAGWHLDYGKQGPVPFLPGEAEMLVKM